jgi:hypothetical protein
MALIVLYRDGLRGFSRSPLSFCTDKEAIMAQAATGSHCSLKEKYRKTFSLTPSAPADLVALIELAVHGSNCSLMG